MKSFQPTLTRVLPALVLAVTVAVTASIPLGTNRWFYYWDDSAAAFAPAWRVIGERILAGSWPTMIPQMWAGGNITAEALYGTYNPLLLANSVLMASVPNLAIGITLVKVQFLAILAVGTYVLARQFGATKPMAFVAGYAMPFASYTLYFDASSWASGLFAFAFIPHVWWSTRAASAGRVNPLVSIVFAALTLTTGNPYGAVAVGVVYLAVLAECCARKDFRRISGLVWSGSAALLLSLIVYLPLAFTTGVSVRTQSGVSNDGTLRPGLSDILDVSGPTRLPMIDSFGAEFMTVPLGYLAWFIVPLIPWIKWRSLKTLATSSVSLLVFGGIYLVLVLGPSNLWLFRWPVRLLEYAQLPVIVAVAVAMSAGMYRDRIRLRVGITAALLAVQFYSAWSSVPEDVGFHAAALAVCSILAAVSLTLWHRNSRAFVVSLSIGVAAILALQTNVWFLGNYNVTPWQFPRQHAFMEDRFDDRYVGNTFAIAHPGNVSPDDQTSQWGDVVFGNMWQATGVDAVNSYAGISYADFVEALCLNYYGGVTCPDAVSRLESTAPGTDVPWMDALRLETIIVQNSGPYGGRGAFDTLPRAEWDVTTSKLTTVARRVSPLPWPEGRLSAAGPGLTITGDVAETDTRETVTYDGSGTATFALLAWPGWTATVDGEPIPVDATSGGLLQVSLPAGSTSVTIEYSPPGSKIGYGLAALGLALALAQGSIVAIGKRRSSRKTDAH
ncbi:YfhO family protein [Rhodococcoides yunnanense]|uniref:YfhO family protein n=1 Tax=Rhodococcoides yunnanense TaxID=278209 RepID=UPI0009349BF7|nr:YfhO family protein [Rhodococcus yunnanensis]